MYKAIIFDLDGTLLNTLTDMTNSVNETYRYFGISCVKTEDEVMKMVGHGMRNLMEQCFKDKDVSFIEQALSVFLDYYEKKYMDFTRPYPGLTEVVDKLLDKGFLIGVNSNKNDNYTKNLIRHNYPLIKDEYVSGIKPGDKTKPDPTNVNNLIEKMAVKKEEVLYIGDSPTDFQTATNAEVSFLGVTWGFRTRENLSDAGAISIVDEAQEIIDFLLK